MKLTLALLAVLLLPSCPTLPIVRYELSVDAPTAVSLTISPEHGLVVVAHGDGSVDLSGYLVGSGFPVIAPVHLEGGRWVAARGGVTPEVVYADELEGLPTWAQP